MVSPHPAPLPPGEGTAVEPTANHQAGLIPRRAANVSPSPRSPITLTPGPSPIGYVFSALAAPVAQTCSLLYRRFLTCQLPLASNVLPITNRRYGRLKICATLNTYPIGWERGTGGRAPGLRRAEAVRQHARTARAASSAPRAARRRSAALDATGQLYRHLFARRSSAHRLAPPP